MGNLCCLPRRARKEIEGCHEATIQHIWDAIYNEIYMLSHYEGRRSAVVNFPAKRRYEVDGGWSRTYDYRTLDFMFYILRLGDVRKLYYKSRHYTLEFKDGCGEDAGEQEKDTDTMISETPQYHLLITIH